jgi:histidinol-phosphatase (PHP family)
MIDYHIHLERGPYKKEWLDKFIQVGEENDIKEYGFVEHLYLFTQAKDLLYQNEHVKKMQNRDINEYFSFLQKMKEKYKLKIGLEIDYVEEYEDKIRDFVKDLPVDFLIGSVHYIDGWAFDLDKTWSGKDITEVYKKYYQVLLKAAKSNIFDILGHAGNIAYFGHKPKREIEDRIVASFFEEVSKLDIVLEINSGGLYRPAEIVFPEVRWFEKLNQLGIKLTCSSDAHDPENVGWVINDEIIPALKSAGYTHLVTFNKRKKEYKRI